MKAAPTSMMKSATHQLVRVGEKTADSAWVNREIKRAKAADVRLKLAGEAFPFQRLAARPAERGYVLGDQLHPRPHRRGAGGREGRLLSKVAGASVRTVAVLAGRRPDAPDAAERRLPPEAEGPVRAAIAELLNGLEVDLLIASAACGADILGLLAAEDVGVRTQIVLPFDVARFRAESVADRGGDWGEVYDRLVDAAAARGDLIVRPRLDAPDPFAANNAEVIDLALDTGAMRRLAILVWDGRPSSEADATADLAERAAAAGFGRRDVFPLELLP